MGGLAHPRGSAHVSDWAIMKLAVWYVLLLSLLYSGEAFSAKVVGVHDGDSITVLTEAKQQIKIRFDGIDAPELKQDYGRRAKAALSEMVFGKIVLIEPKSKDRYGRTVARIYLDSKNINLEMIKAGLAWHFLKYSKDKELLKAENQARI